jgi:hypothetical protein
VTTRQRLLDRPQADRLRHQPEREQDAALPVGRQPTPDNKTKGVTIMQTDAHNMSCEERRALLAQRRAAIASQLRRLAIELTDLDRKLDDIEQSGAETLASSAAIRQCGS